VECNVQYAGVLNQLIVAFNVRARALISFTQQSLENRTETYNTSYDVRNEYNKGLL